jgi:ribose transport system ATP-binding protein
MTQPKQPADDNGEVMLDLHNVSKAFPGTKALDGVSLQVQAGEIHALVGQNGSGKSTLIKILAGFHHPDHGASATVSGAEFRLGDAAAAHAAGLRFVHQDLGLIDSLDCVDNLALGAGYATGFGGRIRWRRQRAAAREALRRVGHGDVKVTSLVSHLSAFEKTALAIVRAIRDWESGDGTAKVSLLVLDEPTATMPRPEVDKLFGLVRRVAEAGKSVLLVSHHLDEVFAIAHRVTVLRDGRSEGTHRLADLTRADLIRLMTGGIVEEVTRSAEQHTGEVLMSARGLGGRVLRDFDLEVHSGEVVGIAGLNGSGRDEVCELIFGARSRTGTVTVRGKELPPSRPDLAISRGLALVPADRHGAGLILNESVRENLTLVDLKPFWGRWWLSGSRERRAARDWIDKLAIRTSSMDAVVESLSGGNQQKVVMGKWLRTEPAILLLDEPTQGVDVGAQAELHRLTRAVADSSGSAVVLCSSDERELSHVCDRVIVLCEGAVTAELAGEQLVSQRIAQQSLGASAATVG